MEIVISRSHLTARCMKQDELATCNHTILNSDFAQHGVYDSDRDIGQILTPTRDSRVPAGSLLGLVKYALCVTQQHSSSNLRHWVLSKLVLGKILTGTCCMMWGHTSILSFALPMARLSYHCALMNCYQIDQELGHTHPYSGLRPMKISVKLAYLRNINKLSM